MPTKTCPHCRTAIEAKATRCPHCAKSTSVLDPMALCLLIGIFGVLMGALLKACG